MVGPLQEGAERQLPLRAEPGPGLFTKRRVGGLERSALGAEGCGEGRRRPGAAGRDAGVGAALDDDRLAISEKRGDGGGESLASANSRCRNRRDAASPTSAKDAATASTFEPSTKFVAMPTVTPSLSTACGQSDGTNTISPGFWQTTQRGCAAPALAASKRTSSAETANRGYRKAASSRRQTRHFFAPPWTRAMAKCSDPLSTWHVDRVPGAPTNSDGHAPA